MHTGRPRSQRALTTLTGLTSHQLSLTALQDKSELLYNNSTLHAITSLLCTCLLCQRTGCIYVYTHSVPVPTTVYCIAGNFGGQNICGSAIFSQFVFYIFVVAACTAGKGRQGRFIRGLKYSCSSVQPQKPRMFCPTKITRYTV